VGDRFFWPGRSSGYGNNKGAALVPTDLSGPAGASRLRSQNDLRLSDRDIVEALHPLQARARPRTASHSFRTALSSYPANGFYSMQPSVSSRSCPCHAILARVAASYIDGTRTVGHSAPDWRDIASHAASSAISQLARESRVIAAPVMAPFKASSSDVESMICPCRASGLARVALQKANASCGRAATLISRVDRLSG
jgi:hypothetical protein